MNEEKCWLCLRTTPQKILEGCHKLYTDTEVAHTIGTKAAELLRDAYLKEPTKVSGRGSKYLIAAAVYIVGILENEYIVQREIAEAFDVTEPTIKNNYCVLWRILKGDNLHDFHKKQAFALRRGQRPRSRRDGVLEGCHQIFKDKDVAHKIGIKAMELLRDLYFKESARVSGRYTNGLIGAAVYIVSIMEDIFVSQQEVASVYDITSLTVSKNYRYLLKILGVNEEEFLKKRNLMLLKNMPTLRKRGKPHQREKTKPKQEKPKLMNPWGNVPGVVSTARGIHTVEARTEARRQKK